MMGLTCAVNPLLGGAQEHIDSKTKYAIDNEGHDGCSRYERSFGKSNPSIAAERMPP